MSDQPKSAVERAKEYGIDVTLLEASLKLTPEQRLRRLQNAIELFCEFEKVRERMYGKKIAEEIKKLQEKWRNERIDKKEDLTVKSE